MSTTSSRNDWVNPLPGVPDVESPFFDDIFQRKTGPSEWFRIAGELARDGYAVFRFPEPAFEQIAEAIKRDLRDGFDWSKWRDEDRARGLGMRVQDAWAVNPQVAALANNAEVLGLLKFLYGREAFPFQTLNFPVGTQQNLHSDSVHFSSIPERFMCGVWVALEDTDENNGCLQYVPGSHKWPVYANEHIGHFAADYRRTGQRVYEPLWAELMRVKDAKIAPFRAKKGDALIWSANLLHGGGAHLDPARTRWSQVTHYYFEGCSYFTPMHSDPAMGRVFFRRPKNTMSGDVVENSYNGQSVPREFIDYVDPHRHVLVAGLPEDFSASRYYDLNPDVKAAGVDAAEHYQKWGAGEGRRYK